MDFSLLFLPAECIPSFMDSSTISARICVILYIDWWIDTQYINMVYDNM